MANGFAKKYRGEHIVRDKQCLTAQNRSRRTDHTFSIPHTSKAKQDLLKNERHRTLFFKKIPKDLRLLKVKPPRKKNMGHMEHVDDID
jgi:hypothetical protein